MFTLFKDRIGVVRNRVGQSCVGYQKFNEPDKRLEHLAR